MSLSKAVSTCTFSEEQKNMFRLLIAIDKAARPVLRHIFSLGAKDKKPDETLEEYLINTKNVSKRKFKDAFNADVRIVISKDPSCQSFDVTLWFLAIELGCIVPVVSLEDEEYEKNLKEIKFFRNRNMHSQLSIGTQNLLDEIEKLRELLRDALLLTQARYSVDDTQMKTIIAEMDESITSIRDSPIDQWDLKSCDCTALFNKLQTILEEEGVTDLKKWFSKLTMINPASLIAGYDIQLCVRDIFSALEIVEEGRHKKNISIDHRNFLKHAHKSTSGNKVTLGQFILIEGVAGIGKTTLIKMLISDWSSETFSVEQLDHYKIIIPVACRNRSISCLSDLLTSLMPTARKSFQKEQHMVECLLKIPTMIILDGLDELNSESENLFKEILELKNTSNLTVLCTTRPEKVKKCLRKIPVGIKTVHIKIKGVSKTCMEEFIEKYHEELIKKGHSQQKTEDLVKYFKTTGAHLEEHWTLPLNLTLLCLLWAVDPDRVNDITTPVELLVQIYDLTIEKLLERLQIDISLSAIDDSELRKTINVILKDLCKEALFGIQNDAILLQEKAVQRLRSLCIYLKLSHDQILGAFLEQKNSWLPTSIKDLLTFPHKSMQDFFASRCIHGELTGKNSSCDNAAVIAGIQNVLSANNVSLKKSIEFMELTSKYFSGQCQNLLPEKTTISSVFHSILNVSLTETDNIEKYQNTLNLLFGLLYNDGKGPEKELVEELIELLIMTGMDKRESWITLLNSVKCNSTVAEMIAEKEFMSLDTFEIQDNTIRAYVVLLGVHKIQPEAVDIRISDDFCDIKLINELLVHVADLKAKVDCLELHHLYHHPSSISPLMSTIGKLMESCEVLSYTGPVTPEIKTIPKSVKWLRVSVKNLESFEVIKSITSKSLHNLEGFELCVSANFADANKISPLIGKDNQLNVRILDVSESTLSNACEILRGIHHKGGRKKSFNIKFPGCCLLKEGIERMCQSLQGQVRVGNSVWLPESLKISPDDKMLNKLVENTLGCRYGIKWKDEKAIWDL